jgi:hypothetical protein
LRKPFSLPISWFIACGAAYAAPALLLPSASAPAGQEVLLTLSLNDEVSEVSGLMLTVDHREAQPASAPMVEISGLNESRLAPPFAQSLYKVIYGSASPRNPVNGLPIDGLRTIAIVHAEPVPGPADVIHLPFRIPSSAAGGTVYTIRVSAVANDSDGVKFPIEEAIGTVTVEGAAPLLGDVNGNGRVEVGDAIMVLKAALQLITLDSAALIRADVTGNGRVEVTDAVAVLQRAVGLGA